MRIALAAFTPGGGALLMRVKNALAEHELALFDQNADNARAWLTREFPRSRAVIFIGAAGIAVRLAAPLLRSKAEDPAILVMDEKGRFVIPLLSGHLGGANRLARKLAEIFDAQAVITTATDINGIFAVDEWADINACVIADLRMVKIFSAALLAGNDTGFACDFPVQGTLPRGLVLSMNAETGLCISFNAHKKPFKHTLNLVPRAIVLGTGCRKGVTPEAFERFALETLAQSGVPVKAICRMASIDLKRHEPCILAFAQKYGLDFTVFNPEELNSVPGAFASSPFVKEKTGVGNVCERSAIAGGGKIILRPKTSRGGITLALAAQDWNCVFQKNA